MSKTKRGYSEKQKELAFRLYRRFEGNARKVSREMGGKPSHVTVLGWAEAEDWDGKIQAAQNKVREMLGVNKDPLVRQLAKDDVFVVEVLSLLQGIALKAIKRKKSKIIPKNSNELVKLLQFIATEYRLRAGGQDRSKPGSGTVETQRRPVKASLREYLTTELGGGEEAEEAAESLIASLRQELRGVRKQQRKESLTLLRGGKAS